MLDDIRYALTGPVASVSTPFLRNGDIDFTSLDRMVDFIIEGGSRTVLLTCGDSLYTLLTDREIGEVTRAGAWVSAGRALLVAAGNWWLGKSLAFAREARELGAGLYMPLPPEWAGSCTPAGLAEYYKALARETPLMLITSIGGRPLPMETVRVLLEEEPGVLAVKDDICGAYGKRLATLVRDRWAFLSGGRKQNHLDVLPYGADGYLSVYQRFCPRVAREYWKAAQAGDLTAAAGIINRYDAPLMEELTARLGAHFDALIHGSLELFGLAQRWRRSPFSSVSDAQMERLRDFFTLGGLLP